MVEKNMNRRLLEEAGALVRGHFVYASGNHGEWYVNKTAALVSVYHGLLHARVAVNYLADLAQVDALVAPELGAIPFMADVSRIYYDLTNTPVARIMATKIPGTKPPQFEIARDQARFLVGKNTVIIEDVVTKGTSLKSAIKAARAVGAEVVAAVALWNRGGVTAGDLGVPLYSVIAERIPDFPAEKCPLCEMGFPVNTELGKGKEFLATRS